MKNLIVYIFLTLLSTALAQTNKINFAGTNINIGMSISEVFSRINNNHYNIEEYPNSLLVFSKSKNDYVGGIDFNESHKIIRITKNWGMFSDSKEAFKILFTLLKKTKQKNITNIIQLSEFTEPQIQVKEITIFLDDRRIYLNCVEENSSIQIIEVFE